MRKAISTKSLPLIYIETVGEQLTIRGYFPAAREAALGIWDGDDYPLAKRMVNRVFDKLEQTALG